MGNLPVLWDVPAFSYIDQHRKPVTEKDLPGHVWIADFIFTQCTAACPMMTGKMLLLQRKLADSPVKFLSFSVDPEHDTPEVLHEYAHQWNADDGSRWTLLSTDAKTLPATAAGMRVGVEATASQSSPIMHSEQFVLIDQAGKVRGYYNSGEEEAIIRLVADARHLAGIDHTNRPAVTTMAGEVAHKDAATLYASLGCAACHNNRNIAPPLEGLFGRSVALDGGMTVLADDAYIRESIVDPNAKIAAGFAHVMPSYREYLSAAQIDQLIGYIKLLPALNATGGLTTAAVPVAAIDPVCKMKIAALPTSPHADFGGTTYYFCSESCRDQFVKSPGKFLVGHPTQ